MRNVLTLCSGRGSNPHGILSQGILSPAFPEVSPEQTATKGPEHPAYVHGSALTSQSALPRTLPRANGLKVPDTARTYSSNLAPTECGRPRGLSVHVPKRPTRNALACHWDVRESPAAQKYFHPFPPRTHDE